MDLLHSWWTKFYFILLRPMCKLLFKWLTGKCELLRITDSNSSQVDKVKNIERSLQLSQSIELKNCAVKADLDIIASTERIQVLKKISPEDHPQFQASFQDCLFRIRAYNKTIYSAERLRQIKFSSDNEDHINKIKKLWDLYCSEKALPACVGNHWTEIGFQGDNPATDFRGMGLLGLDQLIFFADCFPQQALQVLGLSHHPLYGFSFAIVGINMTEMCFTLLNKRKLRSYFYSLRKNEPGLEDFHSIYCHIFNGFAKYWIAKRPKDIMEFGSVREKYLTQVTAQLKAGDITFLSKF